MFTFIICLIFAAVCLAVCALLVKNAKTEVKIAIVEEKKARKDAFRNFTESYAILARESESRLEDLQNRVKQLEDGMIPDFEKAKEAAKAVNDFNKGISAIMGYDPFEARRKAQEERGDNR